MINKIIIIIVLFIALWYYTKVNIEGFEDLPFKAPFTKPEYYPISYQRNISIDNTIPEAKRLDNFNFRDLISLVKQTKEQGNKGILKLKFNQPFLPVVRDFVDSTKVKPIAMYFINTINKLGTGFNMVKLVEIKDVCREETDIDIRITFDMHCEYLKKLNIYHYMNRSVNIFGEKIDKNTFKISDVVIRATVISSKALVDDIFENQSSHLDKMYIDKLYIVGLMHSDYLPGSQVSDFWKYYQTDRPFSNKIIDERYIMDKKKENQQEINGLTNELDTSII